jgi:hypothetical protein
MAHYAFILPELLQSNAKHDKAFFCPEFNRVIQNVNPVIAFLRGLTQFVKPEAQNPVLNNNVARQSAFKPFIE